MLSHDTVDYIVTQGAQQVHGQVGHGHDTAGGRPATWPRRPATRPARARAWLGRWGARRDTIGRIVTGGRPGR